MLAQPETQDSPDIMRYLRAVWGRRRQVIALVAAASAGAAAVSALQGPEFTATAMLFPRAAAEQQSAPVSDPRPPEELIKDSVVLDEVAEELGSSVPQIRRQTSLATDDTGALTVSFSADEARAAVEGATAVATALAEYQDRLQREALSRSLDNLQVTGEQLQQQVGDIDRRLAKARRENDLNLVRTLEATRDSLILQIVSNETAVTQLRIDLASLQAGFVQPPESASSSAAGAIARSIALAAIGAFLLGIIIAVAAERVAERVSGRSELEGLIGAPVTPALPLTHGESGSLHSDQAFAEAVRAVRARVEASTRGTSTSLLITSPSGGDGKTTCVLELGRSFGKAGRRCLVVSTDLRHPTLESLLGGSPGSGIRDFLEDGGDIEALVQDTPLPGVYLLSAGRRPDDPSNVFKQDAMAKLVQEVSAAYDVSIFDSPAALTYADASFLAPLVDQTLVIVDVIERSRPEVKRTVDELRAVGGNVAGAVPNKVGSGRSIFLDLQI